MSTPHEILPTGPRPTIIWETTRGLAIIIFKVFFDLKSWGTRNLPRRGGVLLVSNHQSYLDPPLLAMELRRPLSFLAKAELFSNPLFGWYIRSLNAFPVRQGEGDVAAVRESIRRLKEGHVLNVFPEGQRSLDGQLGPMQPGVGMLARRANVPILPAVIDGSYEAWPRGRKTMRFHPIHILYGKPLDVSGMKESQTMALVDRTLREMLEQIKERRTW